MRLLSIRSLLRDLHSQEKFLQKFEVDSGILSKNRFATDVQSISTLITISVLALRKCSAISHALNWIQAHLPRFKNQPNYSFEKHISHHRGNRSRASAWIGASISNRFVNTQIVLETAFTAGNWIINFFCYIITSVVSRKWQKLIKLS